MLMITPSTARPQLPIYQVYNSAADMLSWNQRAKFLIAYHQASQTPSPLCHHPLMCFLSSQMFNWTSTAFQQHSQTLWLKFSSRTRSIDHTWTITSKTVTNSTNILKYLQYSQAAAHILPSNPSKHTASLQCYTSHFITHLAPPLYWQALHRQPDKWYKLP